MTQDVVIRVWPLDSVETATRFCSACITKMPTPKARAAWAEASLADAHRQRFRGHRRLAHV